MKEKSQISNHEIKEIRGGQKIKVFLVVRQGFGTSSCIKSTFANLVISACIFCSTLSFWLSSPPTNFSSFPFQIYYIFFVFFYQRLD